MPNIIDNNSGLTWYYTESYTLYPIGGTENTNNAKICVNMLRQLGWTDNALAAFLGNLDAESTINPGLTESGGGGGYGLVQWTPKSNLTDVLKVIYPEGYTIYDGTSQMNVIIAEYQQTNAAQGNPDAHSWGIERQWYNSSGSKYGFSLTAMDWYEWAHSTLDLETLTKLYMVSYERPSYDASINHWERRVSNANWYYTNVVTGGYVPPTPGGGEIPIWMLFKFKSSKGGLRHRVIL